ncbi:MAG TPA: T9SS type A sorting domain-containing protein [Bacteroides sp.]|nr:T9SS type A sorting domain-containing protein [Bacteroides sp.]
MKTISRLFGSLPILPFLTIILFSNLAYSQTSIDISGNITSDTIWSADTVRVIGDIKILDDVTLTIEPGTRIEFQGYFWIHITGTLLAIGEANDTIIFTINDNTGFDSADPEMGAWKGLLFDDSNTTPEGAKGAMDDNDSSIINACRIEYIKSSGNGSITFRYFDRSRISNSRIQHCKAEYTGGALHLRKSHILVRDNVITQNYAAYYGGGIECREFHGQIINNEIHSNYAEYGGGGVYIQGGSYALFKNNIIADNFSAEEGGGIRIISSDPILQNNLIVNNSSVQGGGISVSSSNVDIINNTICNNEATGGSSRAGISSYESNLNLVNTILWGNDGAEGPQLHVWGISNTNFYNCLIQGGLNGINNGGIFEGEYFDNIDADPGFVDESAGAGQGNYKKTADWSLEKTSACINLGSSEYPDFDMPQDDITGGLRIQNNLIDIGAYEYHVKYIDACDSIENSTSWTADTVKINCDIFIPDSVILIIDHGTVVQFQGHHRIEVSGIIKALGREGDSILFTIRDTTGFSNKYVETGGWGGIFLKTSSQVPDTSIFNHCIFQYGKKNSMSLPYYGAAMHITNTPKVKILNCDFRYNSNVYGGGGAYITSSKTMVKNSIFRYNYSGDGGGLYLSNLSDIEFSNNTFYGNTSAEGGGLMVSNSKVTLSNSTFYRNKGDYGGGAMLYGSKTIVSKCRFFNNQADTRGGGLYIPTADYSTKIVNTVIANNTSPAGGAISHGGAIIMNSTIVNNSSGFYNQSELPKFINAILWNNGEYEMKLFWEWAEPLFYNCIIMGDSAAFQLEPGTTYTGSNYINNLDTTPGFIDPSGGIGYEYDAMSANWALSPFSPCINQGVMDMEPIDNLDLLGNPRINGGVVDIGAIENQAGIPDIVKQPANKYACIGESIEFQVQTSDTSLYQWQKNGLDIPGATSRKLIIDSVGYNDEAGYNCLVSNNFGSNSSAIVLLIVRSKPEVVNKLSDIWITNTGSTKLEVLANGTQPISYQWQKDGTDIPDARNYRYEIANDVSDNQGTYLCKLSNLCGNIQSDSIKIYSAPQICMVTVSTASGHNLVIWEKNTIAPLMAYNVYRESQSAGIYDRLATIPFDELSLYVDTTADPTVQAYLYKLTAVDTAEYETDADLCKVHKTVHLLVSTNPELNTTQLEWDRYFGFDYITYNIYKSTTGLNFDLAYALSASLNSWTDPAGGTGDLFYRIAVEKPDPCWAEGGEKKAGTGPYQHSLSNMDDNKLKEGNLPPDSIWIDKFQINENNAVGALVGRFHTIDPDTSEIHSYILTSGQGDDDNNSFTLIGDLLIAASSFDFEERDSLSIRIRSIDKSGNYLEATLLIEVTDLDETVGIFSTSTNQLMVYPNPFSNTASIVFPNDRNDRYILFVTDLAGKIVRTEYDITTNRIDFERRQLPSGLYLIELRGPKTLRGRMVVE